jgi:hypothetical protein
MKFSGRRLFFLRLLAGGYALLAHFLPARAADSSVFFPDLSKADPVSYIVSSFNYVAGFIAALVVLVALWGVIKLMAHPGSSSDKSESRGIFWNLLIGVLFFALIYFFFANILSPDLGALQLPNLNALNNPATLPGGGSGGSGGSNQLVSCSDVGSKCATSPQAATILSCMSTADGIKAAATTFQGTHNITESGGISCHFGGRNCQAEGAHAIDWGKNGLGSVPMQTALDDAVACGASNNIPTACRCESENGTSILPCSDPGASHVHCNVDSARCGCN